jgi:hypothetical protein
VRDTSFDWSRAHQNSGTACRADGSVGPKRSKPIQRRPTDPQFRRHFVNIFDRQTFVAVPLQKAADRLFASASLKLGAPLFIIVKEAFFDIYHAPDFAKTFGAETLTIDGQVNAYYQIKWIFSNIMDKPKSLISLHPISQPKMAPDSLQISRWRTSICISHRAS